MYTIINNSGQLFLYRGDKEICAVQKEWLRHGMEFKNNEVKFIYVPRYPAHDEDVTEAHFLRISEDRRIVQFKCPTCNIFH